jgi:uncharacterized protein (TIGR02271 family)
MFDENQIQSVMGSDVYGSDGDKIGRAGQVYVDDQTGRPEWVTVNTGLFGMNESFVPLGSADLGEGRVTVPFTKDVVKDAPNVSPDDGHLSPDEEQRLYEHYGVGDTGRADDSGLDATGTGYAAGDARDRTDLGDRGDTSGPDTDSAMTRSEEQLKVGTETRETGRARLRKYVTTEEQQITVPVTREEVRLEREPITEGNRGEAMSGADISEEEHEITLHEERPVVTTEAVPVERVRLDKEQVTEQEQVSGEVRKEHIEADGVEESDRSR